ncbi:MAG: hypothetical protein ACRD2B_06775 [Terriglobia bacterium]
MESPFSKSVFVVLIFLLACSCLPQAAWSKASAARGATPGSRETATAATVEIPGPLRSFLRMAAISQKVSPRQVLPLLARNVVMEGYGWRGKTPEPTEYLILLKRYLKHAKELLALAGPQGIIRVSSCSQAQPLLTILGYKLSQPCGPDAAVEAAKAKRAFLTIDSGFPLTNLVETLQGGKPFVYPFSSSRVPVLLQASVWVANAKIKRRDKDAIQGDDLLGSLVRDPELARLYWAMSRMDVNTRRYLDRSPGLAKLIPLAPVLDFYGSDIYIRSGRVVVPGEARAGAAWKSLVGASPTSPSSFIMHLLKKDEGWLAAYYAALSRVSGPQQAYFTEPHRLHLFYRALRGQSVFPSPSRPVFRPNSGMLLLVTQLQIDPSGQPHVPGNLRIWEEILQGKRKSHSKIARLWARRARGWKNADPLIASLFALSRVNSPNNPLQVFLVLSDVDRGRSPKERLRPQTVRLLAEKFPECGDQYSLFSEFHALNDASIRRFLGTSEGIDRIHDRAVRADALGIFQANVGLWQILARQREIPTAKWNRSWQRMIRPFADIHSSAQLFRAGESSLGELLRDATGTTRLSEDQIVTLLAGPDPTTAEGQRVRQELAYRMRAALDAQRLVSLDTLFTLGDDLNQMAHGKSMPPGTLQMAGELREFKMPKPLFSPGERAEWSYGVLSNPHIQAERSTNLAKTLAGPRSSRKITLALGQLTPFFRDTLVGLNYAYYQPPGAEVLYNSPLFVRSHDFLGETIIGAGNPSWKTPAIFGRGWTASGGAHLVGSLADLPYVLAEVEQDFIVPENVQALIWEDMVPTLITSSVVPRWWDVTRAELHAVALYQEYGEELVTASVNHEELRQRVMQILSQRLLPQKSDLVLNALLAGQPQSAVAQLAPADTFYLAAEFRKEFPDEASKWGKAGAELDQLAQQYPNEVSLKKLSEDFGVPHPALADTYAPELLNVKPFPTFLGYSSRLLAESWESNNLYWARLADEMGDPPVMLNILAPEMTRRMIANIFATDLQDRPALLRALRATGHEFLKAQLASSQGSKLPSGGL